MHKFCLHQAENLVKSVHQKLKAGLYVWHMLHIPANLMLNILINITFMKKITYFGFQFR